MLGLLCNHVNTTKECWILTEFSFGCLSVLVGPIHQNHCWKVFIRRILATFNISFICFCYSYLHLFRYLLNAWRYQQDFQMLTMFRTPSCVWFLILCVNLLFNISSVRICWWIWVPATDSVSFFYSQFDCFTLKTGSLQLILPTCIKCQDVMWTLSIHIAKYLPLQEFDKVSALEGFTVT